MEDVDVVTRSVWEVTATVLDGNQDVEEQVVVSNVEMLGQRGLPK